MRAKENVGMDSKGKVKLTEYREVGGKAFQTKKEQEEIIYYESEDLTWLYHWEGVI